MDKKAFENVRVIEYCDGIGAAYCGKLLADMGAQVIKVEKPICGSRLRHLGPFKDKKRDIEKSCIFFYTNTNKMSVTLDLEKKEGQDVMKKLLADADVFIKEGQPEWYDMHGLGYETLKKANPRLIVASITPYGESGPYKNYMAEPLNLSHMSGVAALCPTNSWHDLSRQPVSIGGNFEQYDVGTVAVIGVSGALFYREKTGKGQYMELSSLEALLQIANTENNTYPVYNYSQDRRNIRVSYMASEIEEAKDGWVNPFFVQPQEFERLAHMMGHDDWVEEGWLLKPAERMKRIEEVHQAFKSWIKQYTRQEVADIAQKNKVAVGPVVTPNEAIEAEQLIARNYFINVEHSVWGKVKMAGAPFILSKTPFSYEKTAPLLGEDNDKVYKGILGMSADQINGLKSAKVI